MGKLFSQTDSALIDPRTQQPTFMGSPSQVLSRANANLPSADAMLGPDVLNPNTNAPNLPSIGTPTPQQAAQYGAAPGGTNALSPGLSRLGKLGVLLAGGIQGALAGRAADEAAIAASGGRRSGGVGTGFQGAVAFPWMRGMQQAQLQRAGLENQMSQTQLQQMQTPITLPNGTQVPMWRAKQMLDLQDTQSQISQRQSEAGKNRYVPSRNGILDTQTQQIVPGSGPLASPDQQFFASRLNAGDSPEQAYAAMNAAKSENKQRSPEQQFLDEYRQNNPDSSIADAEAAFRKNDPAFVATQNNLAIARQQRTDAENERSYQFHAGRLDKLRQPVEQQLDRLSRLSDTLSQGTPQADALIAPELLTAMAGGSGSGLRMNEAEISRIVGGRTNWESLKAKEQAWQTDPNKGFALTAPQRVQVRALLDARTARLRQQQGILDKAGDDLVNAGSPTEHRAIYNRTQQALSSAMSGNAQSSVKMRAPNGQVQDISPDQVDHYKSMGATVVQ